jgi:hypothetical protein
MRSAPNPCPCPRLAFFAGRMPELGGRCAQRRSTLAWRTSRRGPAVPEGGRRGHPLIRKPRPDSTATTLPSGDANKSSAARRVTRSRLRESVGRYRPNPARQPEASGPLVPFASWADPADRQNRTRKERSGVKSNPANPPHPVVGARKYTSIASAPPPSANNHLAHRANGSARSAICVFAPCQCPVRHLPTCPTPGPIGRTFATQASRKAEKSHKKTLAEEWPNRRAERSERFTQRNRRIARLPCWTKRA